MDTVKVRELYRSTEAHDGKTVRVEGWARTYREGKQFGFIALNDGSFFEPVQVVIDKSQSWTNELKVATGAAVRIEGLFRLTPEAPQPFEIYAGSVEVIGDCPPEYPLQKKRHSVEYLRTIPHLRPRTNLFNAVFRVRSVAAMAIHEFFQSRNFVYVHTPIITTSDCEGAGEMFRVSTLDAANPPMNEDGTVDFSEDFFSKEALLTVSGQLNAEAFALSMRDVYTFGPTFRAELSNTPRHAAEFWMIEPEMAFCDLAMNLEVIEAMTKHIVRCVYERCPEEMRFFETRVDTGLNAKLNNLMNSAFGRITYTDAIDELKKSGKNFQFPVSWGCDLQTEHERYLSEELMKKPVFVTDYPKEIKAFYMRLNDDGKTVAAADLLVPGVGELVGSSQREERYEVLERRIAELGIDAEPYWWYLELRKYGGVPHSGFGLGFERMLMYMTGISNIRDAIPFPRTTGSAEL